ncbi:MAG: hypothetical protein P9L99_17150 [Candidatus Lernaella stagnicola]|nr:hypothetical protein [Candidatus Lernaella stagnicola]
MATQYPKEVNQYRKVLGVLGVYHLLLGAWIALWPGILLRVVNVIARVFSAKMQAPNIWRIPADEIWHFVFVGVPKADEALMMPFFPDHGLFLAPAVGFILLGAFVCLLAYFKPETAAPYVPIFIAANVFTGLFGLGYYLWSYAYLANLLLPIADWSVALLVLIFWLRAKNHIGDGNVEVSATE